ncbi:hypothetical protein B0I26_11738 [Anoxybacillus vitaminiphilus]|jgi:hypothetical protein|uniref:Uncharacterized protein n=1 Tax=Paranoxybacillus vitaminiphilus TaxID=581036 RepID=A0A327Y728_9BACL|nr:hypothetical protein [Anoxybacillus vitaminiphilus]RAK16624.1 hypothetical protein B0I26_11738 [Anoxybacillus vitaminiphilus]
MLTLKGYLNRTSPFVRHFILHGAELPRTKNDCFYGKVGFFWMDVEYKTILRVAHIFGEYSEKTAYTL